MSHNSDVASHVGHDCLSSVAVSVVVQVGASEFEPHSSHGLRKLVEDLKLNMQTPQFVSQQCWRRSCNRAVTKVITVTDAVPREHCVQFSGAGVEVFVSMLLLALTAA